MKWQFWRRHSDEPVVDTDEGEAIRRRGEEVSRESVEVVRYAAVVSDKAHRQTLSNGFTELVLQGLQIEEDE